MSVDEYKWCLAFPRATVVGTVRRSPVDAWVKRGGAVWRLDEGRWGRKAVVVEDFMKLAVLLLLTIMTLCVRARLASQHSGSPSGK